MTTVAPRPQPTGSQSEKDQPTRSRPNRSHQNKARRWPRLALLGFVGLVVLVLAMLYGPGLLPENSDTNDTSVAQRDSETVQVGSLADQFSADGQLVFADTIDLPFAGPGGVVTQVAASEAAVEQGDVIWRILGEPTVALFGEVPASRALAVDAVGPDVAQLETALVALGYDSAGTVTVDDTFTAETTSMVQRWQEDVNAEVTGVVADGAVVFIPGPSRVASVFTRVGDTAGAGGVALQTTSLNRVIEFSAPASERGTLAVGDGLTVSLPDRSTVDAEVSAITIDAEGGIAVTATTGDDVELRVDTVPVTARWEVPVVNDVLTVSAGSLVRTDNGNYNVEVRRSSGIEELVSVEVGRASGTRVEISGDIAEGDEVIAP